MKVGPLSGSRKRFMRAGPAYSARVRKNGWPASVNMQLRTWKHFVTHVEKGYDLSIHDYTNRLTTRDQLQAAIDAVSTPLLARQMLLLRLTRLDNRLRNATRTVLEPLLPPLDDEMLGWWWYVVPNKLSDELSPPEVKTWEPYFTGSSSLRAGLTASEATSSG